MWGGPYPGVPTSRHLPSTLSETCFPSASLSLFQQHHCISCLASTPRRFLRIHPFFVRDWLALPPLSATPRVMTSTAHRRLLQEYRALTNNPPEGITAGPISEDDLLHWECLIQGPEGTPFEGGVFPAELKFPKDYPLAPPSMKFLADVWHPNGPSTLQSFACSY